MLIMRFKRYGCPTVKELHFLIGASCRRSLSLFTVSSFSRVKYALFSFSDAAASARDDSDEESGEAGDWDASSAASAAYASCCCCEYSSSSGFDDFFIFFEAVAMIPLV